MLIYYIVIVILVDFGPFIPSRNLDDVFTYNYMNKLINEYLFSRVLNVIYMEGYSVAISSLY